jgi:hypothetical protein
VACIDVTIIQSGNRSVAQFAWDLKLYLELAGDRCLTLQRTESLGTLADVGTGGRMSGGKDRSRDPAPRASS